MKYSCEMNLITTIPLIVSCIIVVVNCGDYYRIDGRTYFTSYPETGNWYQAKRFCTLLGTQLIDVPNENENNRILSVVNETETRYNLGLADWWTSGTSLGNGNGFYWATTGAALEYSYWDTGEPRNLDGEYCIQYFNVCLHKWESRGCLEEKYFICRDPAVVTRCAQQNNCCPI